MSTETAEPVETPPAGAGISLADGQQRLAPVVTAGPRYSEWLPDVLEALLSATAATAADVVAGTRLTPHEFLVEVHGVTAANFSYAPALVRWHHRYAGVDDEDFITHKEGYDQIAVRKELRDLLTEIGTGQEPEDKARDALARGPVAVLALRDEAPALRIALDGEAWIDADDTRTGERALGVLEELGAVVDLDVVASPRLAQYLVETYPDWAGEHLTLERDGPTPDGSPSAEDEWTAWEAINEWASGRGRPRLLHHLDAEESRAVPVIKDDPEVDLGASSVDRYLAEFEDAGLVDVDRRRAHNQISLTPLGRAAQGLIDRNYRLLHPQNSRPSGPSYSNGPVVRRSSVSRQQARRGGQEVTPAEEWLAATGQPDNPDEFVRWLGDDTQADAYDLHRRLEAGKRVDGVTFVDDRVEAFNDPRVAYLSCFDDHAQVVTQWGGVGPTLVRMAATLSSGRVWGKILTREAVGEDLDGLVDGDLADGDRLNVLQRGYQLGWLSREQMHYHAFCDRLHNVGRRLLSDLRTLSQADGEDDSEAWGELLRDAHGLLATMTSLLSAVGVDVTLHVRLPNVGNIVRDEIRLNHLLGFLAFTVPKQAQYGTHSAWRNLMETRPEKLRTRLPMEVDPDDSAADMTASVVVTGAGAEELVDPAAAAINGLEEREAVREGAEETFGLHIPVARGTAFTHVKSIVDDVLTGKGWLPGSDEIRRLTRVLVGVLGKESWQASPYAVAEALLSLARANSTALGTHDLRHALASLPAERLFPALAPSAQKMVKALLAADGPLGPAELQEEAGISQSSYKRYLSDLEAVGLVVRTEGQWQAVIEPWWAAESTADRPEAETGPEMAHHWADDMLYELALVMGAGLDAEVWGRDATLEEIGEAVPDLEPWIPWVVALVNDPPDGPTAEADVRETRLGSPPGQVDDHQTALNKEVA